MSKKISQFAQIIDRDDNDWLLIEEASTGAYKRIKVSDFIAGLTTGNTSTPTISDPYFSDVVFLLHLNGDNNTTVFPDVKGKNVTASGNAKISTYKSRFGGSSAFFGGGIDYLNIPYSADFIFGTSEFTIEFFVNFDPLPASDNTYYNVFELGTYQNGIRVGLFRHQGLTRIEVDFNNSFYYDKAWSPSPDTNSWYHVAVTRDQGILRYFIDGILIGYASNNSSFSPSIGGRIGGTENASSQSHFGYVDEVRVTKKCRYTANFTPPNEPFFNN